MPFRQVISIVLTSGSNRFSIYPTNFPRLLGIADDWKLYRFRRFRFRIKAPGTLVNELIVAAYSPSVMDTIPAFGDLNEFATSVSLSLQATCDGDWMNVPPAALKGPLDWYWAIPGTASSVEEVQGTLALASSNSASTAGPFIEMEGDIEFSGSVDSGSTPEMRVKAHMSAKKEELLRILAFQADGTPGAKPPSKN